MQVNSDKKYNVMMNNLNKLYHTSPTPLDKIIKSCLNPAILKFLDKNLDTNAQIENLDLNISLVPKLFTTQPELVKQNWSLLYQAANDNWWLV